MTFYTESGYIKDMKQNINQLLDKLFEECPKGTYVLPKQEVKTFKLPFQVYPNDLPKTMTYIEAERYVKKEIGNDWRIPTLEELKLMYEHKDEIGGFTTTESSGSDSPDWYWSSTEDRGNSSNVRNVRFSDGFEHWDRKDLSRLSCRPVRLVPVAAL